MSEPRPTAWSSALSRRKALVAAGGLAARLAGTRLAGAQEATPPMEDTTDAGEHIFTMFVQTAQAGGFRPKEGEDGVYQVVLYGATAQTVYFSDRPHRIVGSVSTADFLAGLGFSPENPPNAAIVAQTEDGGEDVLVVELLNPQWDSFSGTLTYDVIVLDEYTGDGFGELAQRQDDGALPETFGHTSLFIDDCPSVKFCFQQFKGVLGPIPRAPIKMCLGGPFICVPCSGTGLSPDRASLGRLCAEQYPNDCSEILSSNVWTCTGI
jgi:hypothetical protein